jgi:hypothetical protein
MDYLDFNLKVGPRIAENEYAVAARSVSMGEARAIFRQPLNDEQLELFVLRVGLARRGVRRIHSPEWRAAQEFGQKLFRALFTDEIGAAYLSSHNDAVRQGKGLRVKLTLDAPELANYPWEFLYDPSNSQFLSLFEDTPLLRYVELPRPILPLTVTPPLRILAAASSPNDYEPLDIARERRNLAQALNDLLGQGAVELDWLPVATLDALREQLLKRSYHIFHFIGHGGFDRTQEDGLLVFENTMGMSNRVSGERLAVLLGNHRTLRLTVLNACEGARTSQQDPFAGAAATLLRTGNLPAVVAMQFEITDSAAIDFARGFYSAIAAGRPVDAAVSQGRQAIFAHDNDIEWSTPVLYLRAADGVIFDVDSSRAPIGDRAAQAVIESKTPKEKEPEKKEVAKEVARTEPKVETSPPQAMPESAAPQPAAPERISGAKDDLRSSALIQSLPVLLISSVVVWTVAYAIPVAFEFIGEGLLLSVILGAGGMVLVLRASRFSISQHTGIIILLGYVGAIIAAAALSFAFAGRPESIVEALLLPLYEAYPDSSVVFLKRVITPALFGTLVGLIGGVVMWRELRQGDKSVP